MKERLILDCDPGIDDALALMCVLAPDRAFDVLGVTAVAGNMPLETTVANARALTAFLGKPNLPVLAGAARPLRRPSLTPATGIHGENGLGGWQADMTGPSDPGEDAAGFIAAAAQPGPVTLCPIGPMTTIAQALGHAPSIAAGIDRIIFMGGAAFVPGNVTAAAEFNVWADPDAAAMVLSAPVAKVMIGLDVTLQVAADDTWIRALADGGTVGQAAATMLAGYNSASKALHDPCVPVYLEKPGLFDGVRCSVRVETAEGGDYGRTVAEPDTEGDTLVLTEVDADGVRAHVAAAIRALDGF